MAKSYLDRITINPDIVHENHPLEICVYTVVGMLEYLAGGDTIEELLKEFPDLE